MRYGVHIHRQDGDCGPDSGSTQAREQWSDGIESPREEDWWNYIDKPSTVGVLKPHLWFETRMACSGSVDQPSDLVIKPDSCDEIKLGVPRRLAWMSMSNNG